MLVVVVLVSVELEQDAAGVLWVDVGFRPAVGAADAAKRLDAALPDGFRGRLDVRHFEGDVVQAGAALSEEAVEEAVLAQRLKQLEVGGAAGHLERDTTVPLLLVLPAAGHLHAH